MIILMSVSYSARLCLELCGGSLFQSRKRLNFSVHFVQDVGYHHGKTVFKGWVRGNKLPDIFREHPSRAHMTHMYATGQAPGKVMNTKRGTLKTCSTWLEIANLYSLLERFSIECRK